MKQIVLSFILFLTFPFYAQTIVHHDSFSVILDYLNQEDHHEHTLVLIDIDNTIAQPAGTFVASDQWVSHHIKLKMNEGLTPRDAWLAIKDQYVTLQHSIDLALVEESIPQLIQELQSRNITVVIISARLPEIADRTIEQLQKLGIYLNRSALWHEEIIGDSSLTYHYKNGFIFCDGNNKGKVLEAIMKHTNRSYKKVIAVDDKEKNLHDIKKALPHSVEFVGIRYSYLDEIVAQFNSIQAEKDLHILLSAGIAA